MIHEINRVTHAPIPVSQFTHRGAPEDGHATDVMRSTLARRLARYLFDVAPGTALLDVGCGAGLFAHAASERFSICAFDVDPDATRGASRSTCPVWVGTATAIPVRSERFDVITCTDVIEHLRSPDSFLAEAYRILRAKGVLFIRTPNPDGAGRKLKKNSWFGLHPVHMSVSSLETWMDKLGRAGFVVRETGSDLLWDPPYLVSSRNFLETMLFRGGSLLGLLVKPYFPMRWGENLCILAEKPG